MLAAITLGLTCALPASAQGRLYDVELVLFSQLEPDAANPDEWPLTAEPLDTIAEFGDAYESGLDEDVLPHEEDAGLPEPPFATALAKTELQMGPVFYSLRVSGRYRPFLHEGWRQPGVAAELTEAREIAALDDTASISGTVVLTAGTYLHMELDLKLTLPGGTRYTLAERRQVKTAETNYFDHPLFGAIIVVRRAPATLAPDPIPAVEPAEQASPTALDPADASP